VKKQSQGERVIISRGEIIVELTLRHSSLGEDRFGFVYSCTAPDLWHEHGSERVWLEVRHAKEKKQAA